MDNKLTENKSANEETADEEPKKDLKKPLRTVIKKTPEQRALDRLQTNLSESFITISSPIRAVKRLNTENATSATPKKRERMPSAEKSKIAAFLPHRQLWHWSGKYIRRTGNKGSRTRKVYFREIERGRERIKVDDCAVFLSTGMPSFRISYALQFGHCVAVVERICFVVRSTSLAVHRAHRFHVADWQRYHDGESALVLPPGRDQRTARPTSRQKSESTALTIINDRSLFP